MSLSPAVRAVRDAGEKLTGSSNLTREEFLRCVRDLDTALRSPGDDGDAACAEFCGGPPGAPHRAALAWFAGKLLRKGVVDVGDPMRKREDVFTTAAALQVLVSASGGDHRATFGHTSRDGSHERWPKRGYALCHARWPPTVLAPTGILPPLLALTQAKTAGPQVWMRALQLAGSIARCDDAVAHEMARTGWPRVCAEVVKAIPDQAWDEARAREFIVEREVWQWLTRGCGVAKRHGQTPIPCDRSPSSGWTPRGCRGGCRGVPSADAHRMRGRAGRSGTGKLVIGRATGTVRSVRRRRVATPTWRCSSRTTGGRAGGERRGGARVAGARQVARRGGVRRRMVGDPSIDF